MTRPLISTELAYLRSPNQASALKLCFPESHIVFSAQVNGSISTDSVVEIPYHIVTAGAYGDIKFGMTVWLGTAAGGYDLGIARIRKPADGSKIYVGITSDLHLANDKFITVVDDFLPWDRRLRSTSDITCDMDYDIEYDDQYENPYPIVNMGPDAVIYKPNEVISVGNPATTTFDSSDSFVVDGSISSRTWAALGSGISVSNETTDTPAFSVTQTGTWKVCCTMVANGHTTVGWRTLVAFDQTHPPVNQFNLISPPSGDKSSGGWSFEVKLYDQAAIASVKDRQQVILFARDWYTDPSGEIVEVSLGPIVDRENIWCIGWISKDSLHYSPDGSYVIFTVQGLAYWLDQNTKQILGMQDWDGTVDDFHVADWTNYQELTADKGLAALLYWRSTAAFITDIYLTGDDREIPAIEAAQGSLWAQINEFGGQHLLVQPLCNRYGQLYIEVDTQLVPSTDRGSFPVVMTVEKYDVKKGTLDIVRSTEPKVSYIPGSGVIYHWSDLGIGNSAFALSPGHIFKQFGKPDDDDLEYLYLKDQAQLNELTALSIGKANNEYPDIPILLAGNNRFVDICPHQYVYLQRDAADNPRGVEFASNVVPNKITFNFDPKTGFMSCEINGEAETFEDLVVNGDIPVSATDDGGDPVIVTPITPPTIAPIVYPTTTFPDVSSLPTFPIPNPSPNYPSFPWGVAKPAASDLPGPIMTTARTVLEIVAYAWGGTVTFDLELRTTPDVSGTSILTSHLTASSTPIVSTALATNLLTFGKYLIPVIVSTTETPTFFFVQVIVSQ